MEDPRIDVRDGAVTTWVLAAGTHARKLEEALDATRELRRAALGNIADIASGACEIIAQADVEGTITWISLMHGIGGHQVTRTEA